MKDRRSNIAGDLKAYWPTGHRILVLLDDIEQVNKTESGIVIAATSEARDREQQGHMGATVIKTGPTCFNLPHMGDEPWCKDGDRVLIAPYSGKKIPGHPRLRLINDEDVTAVEGSGDLSVDALQSMIDKADADFAESLRLSKLEKEVSGGN